MILDIYILKYASIYYNNNNILRKYDYKYGISNIETAGCGAISLLHYIQCYKHYLLILPKNNISFNFVSDCSLSMVMKWDRLCSFPYLEAYFTVPNIENVGCGTICLLHCIQCCKQYLLSFFIFYLYLT